ncbi:MAG: DUF448 domain-containing protein [Actinobacteria bacterium]|nr:MAG: DUF448 domain-containing protein [Actinomycetota bacterium]
MADCVTEPTRSCVGCGRKAPQSEFLRFVAQDGLLKPGAGEPGRGAYTCHRLSCSGVQQDAEAKRPGRAGTGISLHLTT